MLSLKKREQQIKNGVLYLIAKLRASKHNKNKREIQIAMLNIADQWWSQGNDDFIAEKYNHVLIILWHFSKLRFESRRNTLLLDNQSFKLFIVLMRQAVNVKVLFLVKIIHGRPNNGLNLSQILLIIFNYLTLNIMSLKSWKIYQHKKEKRLTFLPCGKTICNHKRFKIFTKNVS